MSPWKTLSEDAVFWKTTSWNTACFRDHRQYNKKLDATGLHPFTQSCKNWVDNEEYFVEKKNNLSFVHDAQVVWAHCLSNDFIVYEKIGGTLSGQPSYLQWPLIKTKYQIWSAIRPDKFSKCISYVICSFIWLRFVLENFVYGYAITFCLLASLTKMAALCLHLLLCFLTL